MKKFNFLFAVILFFNLTQIAESAAGDLDTTFNNNGIVLTTIGNATVNEATDIVIQPDGKVLVSITSSETSFDINLARYNSDGSLDTSFSEDGIARTPFGNSFDLARAIALQSDGKILIAGRLGVSPSQFVILRYNSNGTLDTTFDSDGIVTTTILSGGTATSIVVQSDGKIVVGGNVLNSSNQDFFTFARYNSNGSLDTSFGNSGMVFVDFGSVDFFEDLIIQPDGKILGVGTGNVSSNNPLLILIRLNPNGSFDTSFDGDGRITLQLPSGAEAVSIDLQPDGKIIVGGRIGGRFAAFRYNANGSIDTSFGNNGIAIADLGDFSSLNDIKIQRDGKIVAGGGSFFENGGISMDFAVVRFSPNGTLDATFGDNGIVRTTFSNNDDYINSLAIQSDGKIIGVGVSGLVIEQKATLVRYLGNDLSANRARFDFDGDNQSDISVFRPNGNAPSNWYILNSSNNSFSTIQFGLGTDTITPADYDGDGKCDIAVYRGGIWYILNSSNITVRIESFGLSNDKTVQNDYDGDGKADLAIYRGGTWHILGSTQGYYVLPFGLSSDKPVPNDYDGDGKTDQAVYRNGEWHILRSNLGYAVVSFGISTDTPVSADFDGDGKTDQAIYRNGVWHVLGSTQGYSTVQFGLATDIPAPLDYDGDGKVDRAVYRDGIWYILRSDFGYNVVQFGIVNDIPIPSSNITQ